MINFSKSLVAASSRPLILGILQEGPSYGYKIIQRVREISGGQMQWADGMLYPVLHKLEKEQFIAAQWTQSEGGRHRKYYSITEAGKLALHGEKENWIRMNEIMIRLWAINPANEK